jgi:hypothetical protein
MQTIANTHTRIHAHLVNDYFYLSNLALLRIFLISRLQTFHWALFPPTASAQALKFSREACQQVSIPGQTAGGDTLTPERIFSL